MNKLMCFYRLALLFLISLPLFYYDMFFTVFITYYIILVLAVSFFGFVLYISSVMSIVHFLAYLLTWNSKYLEEFKDSFLMVFMCIAAPIYLLYIIVVWDTEALEGL